MSKSLRGTIQWYLDDDEGSILTVPVEIRKEFRHPKDIGSLKMAKEYLCFPVGGTGSAWIAESDITFTAEGE